MVLFSLSNSLWASGSGFRLALEVFANGARQAQDLRTWHLQNQVARVVQIPNNNFVCLAVPLHLHFILRQIGV